MYCKNCGKEIDDKAEICMGCGVRIVPSKREDIGITNRLGKIGIPGFRSGKKWKMAVAILGYFWIFVILLAMISGPDNNTSGNKGQYDNVAPEKAKIDMPVPTVDSKQITISYKTTTTDKIGEYSVAPEGKVFLIVTMTIENNGYPELNTNPNYFNVMINNIKYTYDTVTYSLSDKLDTVDIMNGGTLTGSIAFTIPDGTREFQLKYDMVFKDYNIKYVQT